VEQPLRVEKPTTKKISESTQSLPFLPSAGPFELRYAIVRTNASAVKYPW
jgi:hypothetical protein